MHTCSVSGSTTIGALGVSPSSAQRVRKHVLHQTQRRPATEEGAMDQAGWSDGNLREFKRPLAGLGSPRGVGRGSTLSCS